jgi:hypothetical protein
VRRILGLNLPDEDEIKGKLARRLRRLIRSAGLPKPLTEHWVALAAGGGFEVDFCWPEYRLIVETDGRAFHDTYRGFENDRHRDRLLSLEGWTVIRFTWRDVTERPAEVIDQLRGLLQRRASVRAS